MASAKELISRLFTGAKNVVNTLDRDKVSPGFQVFKPDEVKNYATNYISEFGRKIAPYGQAIGDIAVAPFELNRLKKEEQTAQLLSKTRPETAQRLYQNIANQRTETSKKLQAAPKKMLTSYPEIAFTLAGAKHAIPATAIGSGFGAATSALMGEDIASGAGRGGGASIKYAGLNRVTAPFLDPFIYQAGKAAPVVQKLTKRAGVASVVNLAQDNLYKALTEGKLQSADENVQSLFLGAITSPLVKWDPENSFIKFDDNGKASLDKTKLKAKADELKQPVDELATKAKKALDEFNAYQNELIPIETEYGRIKYIRRKDAGFARIPGKEPLPWEQKGYKQLKSKAPEIGKQETQEQLTKAVMAEDAPEIFKSRFNNWIGQRETSKTIGAEQGFEFINFPKAKNQEFIDAAEGVIKSNDPQVNAAVNQWKQVNQTLYPEVKALAKRAGIKDLGYVENYVTHFWKEPQSVVKQKINTLAKTNRSFKGRTFLTYKEGIEAGLTPKYNNPAQILSEYVTRLNQTKANLELFEGLRNDGLLVDAVVGSKQPGFSPINAPGFPKSIKSTGGKIYEGNYYAPDSVARQVNKIFQAEDTGNLARLLKKTAAVSGGIQNVVLSGGIPGKSVNAFSAANIIKEITAGRVRGPIKALELGLQNPTKALNYFKNESKNIQELQLHGVPIRSSLNTDDLMGMQKTAGGVWDAAVSDPTFKRFMPTLQIELYKDIKNRAFRQGVSIEKASETAAKAVKNFYGIKDLGETALRDQPMENLKTTLLFAPQFREAMVNFWVNSIKSLRNPLALENINNTRFLVGSVMTLASMDYLNKQLNGHGMGENPEGKKDKLLIPLDDGTTIGIPFLPSIATIPRGLFRIGEKVIAMKPKEASAETIRTFGSMPISTIGDIMLNEDYFGNKIYDDDEDSIKRAKDIAGYVFKKNTHPWLKAGLEASQKPIYQTISQALELPIRYYQTSTIQNAPFWENYQAVKSLDTKFQELKYQDPQKAVEFYNQNKADLDTLDMLKEQVKGYYQSGKDNTFLQNGGVVQNDEHYAFVGQDNKFHLIDRDFSFDKPKLTGLKDLDKKILSSATSDITAKEKNVLTLFENNIISADEADSILKNLGKQKEAIKAVKSLYGGGKKPKKIAIQKLKTPPKVKIGKYKPKKIKLQTVRSAKIKPLKVAPLKVDVKKYL